MKNNDKNRKWYELDAFAKTYSSIISEGRTTCFRLSILLSENIDIKILNKVCVEMSKKYSFYNSELKKGIFWNYLQQKKTFFSVEEEINYPCTDIKKKNPLRIMYYKNKISLEIAHFLTDGTGAVLFLKDLVEKYLSEKYKIDESKTSLLEEIKEEEYVDLYSKYMRKVNKESTIKKAFHIPIKILEKGHYYATTGEIDIKLLKEESKKYNTTIGKYLLAVYFKILLDKYSYVKEQIVIGVPVDLRKIYFENTYRNFFINITPTIDPSLGDYSLKEIIDYLNVYFQLKINKKEFYKNIYKAMNPMKNTIIRIVPYLVKRIFFPFIFDYYGERGYTTGFSNLGIINFENKYKKYIKKIIFLPPPSKRCKIKVGVISNHEKVYITFGNLSTNREIERDFFTYLKKRNINSKITTNY